MLRPIAESREASVADGHEVFVEAATAGPKTPATTTAECAVEVEVAALNDAAVDAIFATTEVPNASTTQASRLPVLDREQVESIRGLGKPRILERLCEMLFATSKDAFARLDAALAEGNLDAIGAAAHALKSPVSNLGGRRLADLLERCELAAVEARDLAAARRASAGLKAHYAALVAALESETRRGSGTG